MSEASSDQLLLFGQFIDLYYPPIYTAISRLTGLRDEKSLGQITVNVFDELWKVRDQVLNEVWPPAFIYKIMIRHVFAFLWSQGAKERIAALQHILYFLPDGD